MKNEKRIVEYTRIVIGTDECSECGSGKGLGAWFDTYRATETVLFTEVNAKGEKTSSIVSDTEKIESSFLCASCTECMPMDFKTI